MTEKTPGSPVERFMQFLEFVANDPALEDRVASLDQTDTAGLLKIAAESGFNFTIEEFRAVIKEVYGLKDAPVEKMPGNRKSLPLIINRTGSFNNN